MITYIIAAAVMASHTSGLTYDVTVSQSRPGTWNTGKRMTEEAVDANRRIGLDYQAAHMLLEEGRPHDALVRLLPWRERIVTQEASQESISPKEHVSRLILLCYIALEDWQAAVSMGEDRYEYVDARESQDHNSLDIVLLSAAYYLSGQKQQARDLLQIKLREQGTKSYAYYFEDTNDEPLDRENFGYSLMLAAARSHLSDAMPKQVFLRKAIEERPDDVFAIKKLARSLSLAGELAAAIPYYELVCDLGTAEEAKDAAREIKLLGWRIDFRQRAGIGN